MSLKHFNLMVGLPSTDTWKAEFGMSVIYLLNNLNHPQGQWIADSVMVTNLKGSIISRSRELLLKKAMEQGFSHLLFIDSDQTFPRDLAGRLLEHDLDCVACNIATKSEPSYATARHNNNTKYGLPVEPKGGRLKLEKVWRVGTGIMLIRLDALRESGLEPPFFAQYWDEEQQDYVGEDWAFCEKLTNAGISIHIDHELSEEIGHVGDKVYKLRGDE